MSENHHDEDQTRSFVVLTKGTEIGHYKIISKIGAGGMGEVYLAFDTELTRKVALKFLPPHLCQDEECRARFKREAQAAAKLDHPNIAGIYEVGEYQNRPYYAMQLIEGQSLGEVIAGKDLPIEQILEITIQICEGLQVAHDKGIIHRDIKPSNILIDGHGRVRVVDFGLATIRGAEDLTKTGSTLGTIGYMSPEQIQVKDTDRRSDLFSLGVVLYELITGRSPFKRDTEAATLNSILHDIPEPLSRYKSGVSDELQRIVSKLLQKDPETRYQTAAGVVSDLRPLKRGTDTSTQAAMGGKSSSRVSRYLIPALIVVVLALLLILKPFKVQVESTDDAVAAENRLAIMYFENLADPDDSLKLGEITTNLLITDLSESRYVSVVSSQRLYDILKQLGHESEKNIDRNIATQVAKKARAKSMLLGSILNMEPEIILTAQLIDVETGNAIASQRIEGQPGDRIFSLVDKLTVEIKNDLSLPAQALDEKDPDISELTTGSVEAYRYLLKGMDYAQKLYSEEAEQCYRKALTYDSTFAMAYLALLAHTKGEERDTILYKMNLYSEKVSSLEKLYIKAYDAYYGNDIRDTANYVKYLSDIIEKYPDEKIAKSALAVYYYEKTGDMENGKHLFLDVLRLDPLFGPAYNRLAYIYNLQQKYDSSIWAINKYIEVAEPDEANPYDTRGELYANQGELDKAIESYKKALEIRPDFIPSLKMLGQIYVIKQMYAEANDCFREILSSDDKTERANARYYLTLIPLHRGKFNLALRQLNVGIETDSLEIGNKLEILTKIGRRTTIFLNFIRNYDSTICEINRARSFLQKVEPNHFGRNIYINGQTDILNARFDKHKDIDNLINYFNKNSGAMGESEIRNFYLFRGLTELEKENFDSAIVLLNKGYEIDGSSTFMELIGNCYLKTGRLGDAVFYIEKSMNKMDRDNLAGPSFYVLSHYYLAQAYEASGWNDKAIEQFEIFLNIWKNADPGIVEIEDAKQRLSRLKGGS